MTRHQPLTPATLAHLGAELSRLGTHAWTLSEDLLELATRANAAAADCREAVEAMHDAEAAKEWLGENVTAIRKGQAA